MLADIKKVSLYERTEETSCFSYNMDILRGPVATSLDAAKSKAGEAAEKVSALPDLTELAGIKSASANITEIQSEVNKIKASIFDLISGLSDIERENEKKIMDLADSFGIDTDSLSYREILEALAEELGIDTTMYAQAENFSDLADYIPYINQLDYGDVRYGSTSIQKGGCCPTSYAMMVAYAMRLA